jgi:hypothetical protein
MILQFSMPLIPCIPEKLLIFSFPFVSSSPHIRKHIPRHTRNDEYKQTPYMGRPAEPAAKAKAGAKAGARRKSVVAVKETSAEPAPEEEVLSEHTTVTF